MYQKMKDSGSSKQSGYEQLANAIVILAAKDYRDALKKLQRNPRSESAKTMKESVERFFRSEWYSMLTTVDGEFLLRKLQGEVLS